MKVSEYPCADPLPVAVRDVYTTDEVMRQYAGRYFCGDKLHWYVDCNSHGRCFVLCTGACPKHASGVAVAGYTFGNFREVEQPKAYAKALAFAEKPASVGNLIFAGKPGTGKTHLAKAINEFSLGMGRDVVFITRTELHDVFSAAQPSCDDVDRRDAALMTLRRIREADITVFDDFGGAGPQSAFFVEQFRTLLDTMAGNWVLTTNKSRHSMETTYDDPRVISRLYGTAHEVTFAGHDQRTKPRPAELIGTAE